MKKNELSEALHELAEELAMSKDKFETKVGIKFPDYLALDAYRCGRISAKLTGLAIDLQVEERMTKSE